MDEQLTISTPEQVAFEYDMAGIGSRFVAALLDHLILGTVLLLIICAFSAVGTASFVATSSGEESAAPYIVLALLTLVLFLILWGYFVVFETVWNGQTPGKRAGRLRVIRRNGQPITASEAVVRNLVRLVDFLPGFYGIGLVSMFIDKEARRLGDFAAGTIVIREGEQTRLRDVAVGAVAAQNASAAPAYTASPTYSSTYGYSGEIYSAPYAASYGESAQPAPVVAARYDPLPGVSLRDLAAEDFALMRELISRVRRGELAQERGDELAYRMAQGAARRMGQDFAQWQANGWRPLVFLQSIVDAHDARVE